MISAGLDEVGWGSWAGPVISVVAVFRSTDLVLLPNGVTDSKKLSETRRETLYLDLCAAAYDVGIGHAWPWEIDEGPYQALQLSYRRALEDLCICPNPDLLYVDGKNRVQAFRGQQVIEPKADLKHKEVSAASIIAKVFRDRMMAQYDRIYPGWNLAVNKGYGTPDHEEAIMRLGILADERRRSHYLHRRRYCRKVLSRLGWK